MYQKHDREPIIKEHVSIGKKCNLQMSTAGTKITCLRVCRLPISRLF